MTTEEMARELISIVRTGKPDDDERMRLAVKSFEFGMMAAGRAQAKEEAAA